MTELNLSCDGKQQESPTFKIYNWVRRIVGVKREDKWRLEEVREEAGESFRRKPGRSRLKWAGHVEQMEERWLLKRADALRAEGRRKFVNELGGQHEDGFGKTRRGVKNEGEI